jgi:DNA-damage-inducible protein D
MFLIEVDKIKLIMAKGVSKQTLNVFEQIKQIDENGIEFWGARQLARVLNYTDFRNFQSVINKAKEACKNSGQQVDEHLVEVNEVLFAGQGAKQVYSKTQ